MKIIKVRYSKLVSDGTNFSNEEIGAEANIDEF